VGNKQGTQAMHLPGQKQCRTSGAAAMQTPTVQFADISNIPTISQNFP